MGTRQIVFGVAIVLFLVVFAVYSAWRQRQTLRRLRGPSEMPPDEYAFVRNQAWRRLAGAVLMLLLAGLFVGGLILESPAARLAQEGEERVAAGEQRPLNPAEKDFVRFYGSYWVALLLVLLAVIGLAGWEFFAIRRFSVRSLRRLQDERRAMIAREAARLRGERNGHA